MTGVTIGLIMNLAFCLVILALGIWGFIKRSSTPALYMGIAFGFYAVSHVLSLTGLIESLNVVGVVTRFIGYALSVYVIYLIIFKK